MKRVIVIAMVLGLIGIASAANDWLGGTGNWNIGANWSEGVPTSASAVAIDVDGSVVNLTGTAGEALNINMAQLAFATTTLNIAADFTSQGWARFGYNKDAMAAVTVDDNAVVVSKGIGVGYNGSGVLNIHSGTVRAGLSAVNRFGFYVGNQNNGNSNGVVNLYGGTLDLSFLGADRVQLAMLNAGARASLDISGGALVLQGNITDIWDAVTTGLGQVTLTGYGVPNNFAYAYDVGSNTTTVTAIPEPAAVALLGLGGLALIHRKRS